MKLLTSSSKAVNWGLAAAAIGVGYALYGWPGVLLGITIIVFWLLLQFSRALRVLRNAAGRPVGTIDNAVMLHSRLHPGLSMLQVLRTTGSLGRRLPHASPGAQESWEWQDGGGDTVVVDLSGGRTVGAQLLRAASAQDVAPAPAPDAAPRIEG